MGQHAEYLHLLQPKEPAVPVASGELHNMYSNYNIINYI